MRSLDSFLVRHCKSLVEASIRVHACLRFGHGRKTEIGGLQVFFFVRGVYYECFLGCKRLEWFTLVFRLQQNSITLINSPTPMVVFELYSVHIVESRGHTRLVYISTIDSLPRCLPCSREHEQQSTLHLAAEYSYTTIAASQR